jgi:hypothetical protein
MLKIEVKMYNLAWREEGILSEGRLLGRYRSSFKHLVAKAKNPPSPQKIIVKQYYYISL